MTKKQYNNIVLKELSLLDQTEDSVDAIRKIIAGCEVDFPYGICEGIFDSLSNNSFAQWDQYSPDEAVRLANEGIPTIGITKDEVILIVPSDSKINSCYICVSSDLTSDMCKKYKFFSSTNIRSINGWTSDVPMNQTQDGFGGWYHRGCWSEGVVGVVPRFVQMYQGPCLAYSIMAGDYNLNHYNENVYDFFDDRQDNGYIDSSGNALWSDFASVMNFDISELKDRLDLGEPVVVSGRNSSYDHFVLVVAYTGNGTSKSDYTVIDPLKSYSFPITFQDFYNNFPNDTSQFPSYSYPMFIFN